MRTRWRNRKQGWSGTTRQTRAMDQAAQANIAQFNQSFGAAGPARSLLTGKVYDPATRNTSTDTWRTVGPDCPWNSTPGKRQVWHNRQFVSAE